MMASLASAGADTPSLGPMDATPTPELAAAVGTALKALGEQHPEAVAKAARTFQHPCDAQSSCFVRIEHPSYCDHDSERCLTLVMSGQHVTAMYYAGKSAGMAEPSSGIVGSSICFWATKNTVCVSKTPLGWIVF